MCGISESTRIILQMLTKEFTDGLCQENPAGLKVEHFSMRRGVKLSDELVTYVLGKVDDADWVKIV